jgi:hypothetical protein
MPIRIVLADDHVLVRQGLKSLLEREKFQIVAEASNGQEVVRLADGRISPHETHAKARYPRDSKPRPLRRPPWYRSPLSCPTPLPSTGG